MATTTGAENHAVALAERAFELVSAGKTEVLLYPPTPHFAGDKRPPPGTFATTVVPLPSPPDSPQQSRPLTPSQEGSRVLREAISLAPQNARVKDAFVKIHYDESLQPLLRFCRKFAEKHDATAAQEALWYLRSEASQVPSAIADRCMQLALAADATDKPEVKDDLVASLLQRCLGARQYASKRFITTPSPFFQTLYDLGPGSALGISTVALDEASWTDKSQQLKCIDDVFQLFLAKLLESGRDPDPRAIGGIARHMIIHAERLSSMLDEFAFEEILKLLDYRLRSSIRHQATAVIAKFLEVSKDEGEKYLVGFITGRAKKHNTEDLVLAFSCAASAFPLATQTIASLFLVEGFLPSLIPILDKKSRAITVEKAALDMLSAACIDAACRGAIAKHCSEWMHHVMLDKDDERHGQAAVILAKVQDQIETDGQQRRKSEILDVVPTLKEMLFSNMEMDRRAAVEGFAYASAQPFVKEDIAYDNNLLKKLFTPVEEDSMTAAKAFGAMTLLDNLTRYPPKLSEEQQRVSQLRAYANAQKPPTETPALESDEQVTSRCVNLIDAGLVPFLQNLKSSAVRKPLSPGSLTVMAQVLNNISTNPETRGRIAQQGAVPLLLSLHTDPVLSQTAARPIAAHAIARILISVDPKLIAQHAGAVLPPLVSLLTPMEPANGGPRNFLPTFESLIALTNLVSNPSLSCGETFVRTAFSTLEDLMLHDNMMVRRAATELACNLATTCPDAVERFADGSPAANRRVHVLLALADSEDLATRQAAGGALAGISEFDGAIRAIVSRERGIDILIGLCRDEDAGCVHRGVVCLANMEAAEGDLGRKVRDEIRQRGGEEVFKRMISSRREGEIVETAIEAMKGLML